jgi:hypothetical protein
MQSVNFEAECTFGIVEAFPGYGRRMNERVDA